MPKKCKCCRSRICTQCKTHKMLTMTEAKRYYHITSDDLDYVVEKHSMYYLYHNHGKKYFIKDIEKNLEKILSTYKKSDKKYNKIEELVESINNKNEQKEKIKHILDLLLEKIDNKFINWENYEDKLESYAKNSDNDPMEYGNLIFNDLYSEAKRNEKLSLSKRKVNKLIKQQFNDISAYIKKDAMYDIIVNKCYEDDEEIIQSLQTLKNFHSSIQKLL